MAGPEWHPNSISPHGLVREINAIQDMWVQGCLPSPQIWIKAFFPALIPLLITLVEPGRWDYLVMPLGRYHRVGKRIVRRAAEKFTPNFIEAADGIAEDTFLFKIAAPIETALFWFMVLDASTEFFYNWESQAMQMAGCHPGELQINGHYDNAFYIGDGHEDTAIVTTFEGDAILDDVFGFIIPPGYVGSFGLTGRVSSDGGTPITVNQRLVESESGRTVITTADRYMPNGDGYVGGDFARRYGVNNTADYRHYRWLFTIDSGGHPIKLHLDASCSAELTG